jgi:hypothetical protein
MRRKLIDVEQLLAGVDLAEVVGRYVKLKRAGSKEWIGRCPFHEERSASFTVSPVKGFMHCFGCGVHLNAIGFLMRITGADFLAACEQLGAPREHFLPATFEPTPAINSPDVAELWVPICPAPADAPRFLAGAEGEVWNPKRGRIWRLRPERADEYRNARGQLIGYVLRIQFTDGTKITPQISWCIGPDGSMRWCTVPFPRLRPLCGLDALALRPEAPVIVVEGEKCKARGGDALPMYVVVTWPGGSKGVRYADWSPLAGRDVILWPDADQSGREAMLGFEASSGIITPGVAQLAARERCKSIRMIDPQGQPKGWDLADALDDGWTPRQLATWAAQRIVEIDVITDVTRRTA